jgi:NADH-quinone oxidoreductase subunit E
VNHRFFGDVTPETFDTIIDDLAAGRLDDDVPRHGTLVRIRRDGGLRVDGDVLVAEREGARAAAAERARAAEAADGAGDGTPKTGGGP